MKTFAATALTLLLSAAVGTAAAAPPNYGYGQTQHRSSPRDYRNDVAPVLIGALLGYVVASSVHHNHHRYYRGYDNAGYYGNQGYYGSQGYDPDQAYYGNQVYYPNQGYVGSYGVRSGYYGDGYRGYRDTRGEHRDDDSEDDRDDNRGYRYDDDH